MKTIPLFLLLGAAALAGCGDSTTAPAGGGGTDATASGDGDGCACGCGAETAVAKVPDGIDDALAKGVAWLRGASKDGHWKTKDRDGKDVPSPSHTALALAALSATIPADARASDPLVKSAAELLMKLVRDDGGIAGPAGYYDNYFTSCSLMALATINDPAHAAMRDKMKNFLLSIQRKEEGRRDGGFGYNKRQGADLSNAQFAIEALRSAGIPETHESMIRARRYLERVQNRSENEANKGAKWDMDDEAEGKVKVVPGDDGSAGYEPGVSKAGLQRMPDGTYVPRGYGSMTYALLKCYLLTGVGVDDERVQAAIKWLGDNYSWEENPGFQVVVRETGKKDAPYWGLFYYYMTAAKALARTGLDTIDTPEGKRDWRADLAGAIIKLQKADGSWQNNRSERWNEGDPQLATAYAVLTLQEIKASVK